ncbi:hypothetical protein AYO20_03218 [Fonsecaea nubica]|uniref:Acyclic terpene utilisation N-terminal domain-containing protein n=1 Tax=Fonsecaea nubica TaxID=856822 RepID=A0A178D5H5_9EURO|nr:hypothetical protein AYO20_03218 [Fonsecaea nubica]OAL37369.1 hypothetical protein AYO20_03218 [Fonsecaea nubica]
MTSKPSTRWSQKGTRPVRVANCSGARGDPGYQMRRQATLGDVDFITGDYLAEVNLADKAELFVAGQADGCEPTAYNGIAETLDVLEEKRIKVIVNGGSLNPAGLAAKVQRLVTERGYNLKVAYVAGDDLREVVKQELEQKKRLPSHLDAENNKVSLAENVYSLMDPCKGRLESVVDDYERGPVKVFSIVPSLLVSNIPPLGAEYQGDPLFLLKGDKSKEWIEEDDPDGIELGLHGTEFTASHAEIRESFYREPCSKT